MPPIKAILNIVLFVAATASAASLSCETNGDPSVTPDKVAQMKAIVDAGNTAAVSMPQRTRKKVAFPGVDLQICIENPFFFESTTIFPDELSSFLELTLNCLNGGEFPQDALLDGDTSLDIPAFIFNTNQFFEVC
jgi:hypothetical protein